MRLARLQHSVMLAIAAGENFNPASLGAFNAGVAAIIGGNRDATDNELLALENLVDHILYSPSDGSAESNPPLTATGVAEPSGDAGETGVGSSEAGGDSSPQEPESVTAVAPPEAAPAAPAETPAAPDTEDHPADLSQPDVQHLDLTEVQPDPVAGELLGEHDES